MKEKGIVNALKPQWQNLIRLNWPFGLLLIFLFGLPRFILVLSASVTGMYSLIAVLFILMWVTPWVLLTAKGRKLIGIRSPTSISWMIGSFILGVGACALIYFIGKWLFFNSNNNWFVYLSRTYQTPAGEIDPAGRLTYFFIFAAIGMTFSPIGEELLYRGLIHQCFTGKFGEHGASMVDSGAFAITHLAHFGIVYVSGRWQFLWLPAIFWVLFIFLVGRMFYYCKVKTGSIMGAVISHAGFNLAMTYFIIYHIL